MPLIKNPISMDKPTYQKIESMLVSLNVYVLIHFKNDNELEKRD